MRLISIFILFTLILSHSKALAEELSAEEYWQRFAKKLDGIESIYYKEILTVNVGDENNTSESSSKQVWFNGQNFRMDLGMNLKNNWSVAAITNPNGNFMKETGSEVFKYFGPPQMPTLFELLTSPFPGATFENATYKFLGQETIDDEEATVIELTTPFGRTSYTDTFWISNDKQLPLKHVNRWTHSKGLFTVSEFKDYSFDFIPDSQFNVGTNWVDGQQELRMQTLELERQIEEKREKLKSEFADEKKNGLEREYYKNGVVMSEINWKDGQRHGEFKFYSEDGSLERQGEYKNGVEDGRWVAFYKSGNLEFETIYENGNAKTHKYFNEEGVLQEESLADGDVLTINMYRNNGKLSSKKIAKDGKLIKFEQYDEEGNPTSERK